MTFGKARQLNEESRVLAVRLLYLNVEDERSLPFSTTDFHLILETYFR